MNYHSREQFVLSNITNNRKENVNHYLDIGFLGHYAEPFMHYKILKTIGKNDTILGIDINPKITEISNNPLIKNYSEQATYKNQSIFELKDETFDTIFLLEVFEHLPHPYLALHNIYESLNKGGILIMTYPNPLNIGIFYRYILEKNILNKKFLKTYKGAEDHKIFPMPPSMIIYLEYLGFEVKELAFIKGKMHRFPFLNKFSDYIGIVAKKCD